jgi:hypothetical protein
MRLRLKGIRFFLVSLMPSLIATALLGRLWWGEPGPGIAAAAALYPNGMAFVMGAVFIPLLARCAVPFFAVAYAYESRRQRERARDKLVHLLLELL